MSWFERVPKVELHLHLEGAIPHDTLCELVQEYGGDPSVPDLEALERRFEYRDFPHFIVFNVRTGVVNSLEEHPVRRYFERGIIVTLNTDDPKMFGNSLAEEFLLLEEKLSFSRNEIRSLILQGIQAAWLSEDKRQQLVEAFRADPAWQEEV